MRDVWISTGITPEVAERVVGELHAAGNEQVVLHLKNVPGGDFDSAAKIWNAARTYDLAHGLGTIAYNDVASAGAIIWLSARGRDLMRGARLLFHHANISVAKATARDLRAYLDDLDQADEFIRSAIIAASGMPDDDVERLLHRDEFIDRAEAKRLGLLCPMIETVAA